MQEYAEIHEQRRLGYRGAGELLTAWSREWVAAKKGPGTPGLGQVSLAD